MNFIQSQKNQTISSITKHLVCLILLTLSFCFELSAQAKLSVQGILKKSNGVALEDGEYNMTFKIYAVDGTPAGALWTETVPTVELNGGIYSVVLGSVTALTLPFDQDYELGISVGASEMTPRVKLTSAPYALSLRGDSNIFPSTGLVLADEMKVAQGILASGGTPGSNASEKNGYAFSGNNGDNDSGLFSTADGEVSLYSNNTERLKVSTTGVTITGTATATTLQSNQLNIFSDGGINYSTSNGGSFPGWRLADLDDLSSHDGWQSYSPASGQNTGWNQSAPAGQPCLCNGGVYVGNILEPSVNNQVLKKQFTIPGTWSQMKVKFRYYFIDTWGFGGGDMAFAGFSTDVSASTFKVGWSYMGNWIQANGNFNNSTAIASNNFAGNSNVSDYWMDVEMTARKDGNSNSFWVFIGAALDEDTNNEKYAIGSVEVWVR